MGYKTKKDGTPDLRGARTTHELTKHPLYGVWSAMKDRCMKERCPAYKWYGARGITVCAEWMDFSVFYSWAIASGWEKGLTIERNKNSLGYSPDNCSFIPLASQQKNRRNCRLITMDGETKTLTDWCTQYGITFLFAYNRIKMGWSDEDAIKKPNNRKSKTLSHAG